MRSRRRAGDKSGGEDKASRTGEKELALHAYAYRVFMVCRNLFLGVWLVRSFPAYSRFCGGTVPPFP